VLRAVDLLGRALEEVRDGSEPRLPLEVALLKAARPQVEPGMGALLARVERIELGLVGTEAVPPQGARAAAERPAPALAASAQKPEIPPAPGPSPPSVGGLPDILIAWPRVIASAQGQVRGVLERSAPVALDGGVLTVEIVEGLLLHAGKQTAEIERLLVDAAAVRHRLRFVARARRDEAPPPPPAEDDEPSPGGDDLAAQFLKRLDATEVDT